MKQEKQGRPAATKQTGHPSKAHRHFTLSLPATDTLPALALALMIKGRAPSTPEFTYQSGLHATRLPAYVQRLEDEFGFSGLIRASDVPLTCRQLLRRHSKPFRRYHLTGAGFARLPVDAQVWAEDVLTGFAVTTDQFKAAPATLCCNTCVGRKSAG